MRRQLVTLVAFTLVLMLVLSEFVDAQGTRKNNRNRSRNRKKGKGGSCHLKAIDTCLEKVEQVTNNRSSAALIKTAEGIESLCK